MDEATFRAVCGNEIALFAHDAFDNVEDWWGQWVSLFMRGGIDGASMEILPSIGELSILQEGSLMEEDDGLRWTL